MTTELLMRGAIAAGLEQLRKGCFPNPKVISHVQRSSNPDPIRYLARHQRRPGGRTERVDVKVGEPDRFRMQTVQVRGLEHGIAVAREVAVPLVVGDDDDNVRVPWGLPGFRAGAG